MNDTSLAVTSKAVGARARADSRVESWHGSGAVGASESVGMWRLLTLHPPTRVIRYHERALFREPDRRYLNGAALLLSKIYHRSHRSDVPKSCAQAVRGPSVDV